jgi:hypothetical protein
MRIKKFLDTAKVSEDYKEYLLKKIGEVKFNKQQEDDIIELIKMREELEEYDINEKIKSMTKSLEEHCDMLNSINKKLVETKNILNTALNTIKPRKILN